MQGPGRLFDGKTAKAQEVTLTLLGPVFRLEDAAGAVLGEWPLKNLRNENRNRRTSHLLLSVAAEDPARIEVQEPGFIEVLKLRCPMLDKKRSALPGWWKPYLLWGLVGVASVALIFLFVLPFLASQIANLIPETTRSEIGQKAEEILINSFAARQHRSASVMICRSAAAEKELQALAASLGKGLKGGSPVTAITVIRAPEANAFTLPGGRMIILSGLLDMADGPNGFAGVMAHEMGHAEYHHPTRLLVSNAGLAAAFSLLLGDVSGGTFLAGFGQLMVGSAYSRAFEREADRTAVKLMGTAGYDISPMVPLMKRLEAQNDGKGLSFSFLQSHPGMEERLERLKAAGSDGGPALSATDWALIKNMCKAPI